METRKKAIEQIVNIAREHDLSASDIAYELTKSYAAEPKAAGIIKVLKLGYMRWTIIFPGL